MTITSAPDQLALIEARMATGEFESVEDGVKNCISLAIVEKALLAADDFAWAKPLVDQA